MTQPSLAAPTVEGQGERAAADSTAAQPTERRWGLPLHFVPPGIMAWWIDPRHHSRPFDFYPVKKDVNSVGAAQSKSQASSQGESVDDSKLPDGVSQVIAIDPQNLLLVLGTKEGFHKLESIVNLLDRPIPQIEIEAHFVQYMDLNATKRLDIDWVGSNRSLRTTHGVAQPPAPQNVQMGYVRSDFAATLKAMAAQNKVRILSSSRVTAYNNCLYFISTVGSVTSMPIVTGAKDAKSSSQESVDTLNSSNLHSTPFHFASEEGFFVTACVSNDHTITLEWRAAPLVLASPIPYYDTALALHQPPLSIFKLKDAETIALKGLKLPAITSANPLTSENRTAQNNTVIVFVTARIVNSAPNAAAATK